jgi:hypothetical protein
VNPVVVPEPFHEGSGKLAKVAILAAMRDKFWQTNAGQTHDLSIINQPVTSQAFFVPRLGNLVLWHFFDTFVLDNCTNKIPLLSRDNAAVILC